MQPKNVVMLLICCLSAGLSGCSDVPSGFPAVVPCNITVLDGTAPIADAEVSLLAEASADGTIFFGKTDASGVCKIGTTFANYHKVGVPIGNYKVVIVKEPFVEETKTREEQNKMSRADQDAYRSQMKKRDALPRIIPVSLTQGSTTPLKIDVQGGGTDLTINVSEHKK